MFSSQNQKEVPPPVVAAKQEVERLFALEADLSEKRHNKIVAIDAISQNASEAILEGAGIEDVARATTQRQAEVRAIEEAISLARQRRVGAISQRYQTEARMLRESAALKRNEAADLRKRCDALVQKLRDIEGVPNDALVVWAPSFNDPAAQIAKAVCSQLDLPEPEERKPVSAQPDLRGGFLTPRSIRLLQEAVDLEDKAAALEAREVNSSYSITKPTVDEILGSEEFCDPEILVPARYQVERWAGAVEARVKRERPELLTGEGRRRQYKITWREGRIDPDYSSLTFLNTGVISNDATFTAEVGA